MTNAANWVHAQDSKNFHNALEDMFNSAVEQAEAGTLPEGTRVTLLGKEVVPAGTAHLRDMVKAEAFMATLPPSSEATSWKEERDAAATPEERARIKQRQYADMYSTRRPIGETL